MMCNKEEEKGKSSNSRQTNPKIPAWGSRKIKREEMCLPQGRLREGSEKAQLGKTFYEGLNSEWKVFAEPPLDNGGKKTAVLGDRLLCSREQPGPRRDGTLWQQPPPWGWVSVLAEAHI